MNHPKYSATVVGAAALLASWASPCIANENNNDGVGGVISFPLLSHHHVIHRRHLEQQLQSTTTTSSVISQEHDNNLLDLFDRIPRLNNNNNNNLRHLADPAQQQLGALYQGYGTHYIDIWVGYPPQRQTAVVDTGSSVTAFPCSACTNCGHHTDTPFNEDSSTSYRATHCPLTKSDSGCIFGKCDGKSGLCVIDHNFGTPGTPDASSWTAYEATDVAYAGGPHDRAMDGAHPTDDPSVNESNPIRAPDFSFPLTFGCQTSVSGYFEKQLASGVMGLDRRAQSFWGQMRASQVIHRAQFSLCFVKQPIASISGSTAGAVTLGGVDKRLHKTPMVFAKSVGEGSTASFKVRMRKLYLRDGNDQSVMFDAKSKYHLVDVTEEELNGPEMYNFDSGTTDTYFIQSLSDSFRKLWKETTGMDYSNDPIKVNSDLDLLRFPTVILQMHPHDGGIGDEVQTSDPRTIPGLAGNVDMSTPNDVMVAIPPKHYMQRNSKDGTYTSRIYLDRANDLGNVLGANAMMGHDILFDMDTARIGFSESECDYARLIAESGSSSSGGGSLNNGGSGDLMGLMGAEGESNYKICESMKCRGFFGLTMAVFFCLFFAFARRYVTKRETDGVFGRSAHAEYEMKTSSRNLHHTGSASGGSSVGSYSDSRRSTDPTASMSMWSDEHLAGGERGLYRDTVPPPSSYSDHRSSSGSSGRHLERSDERSGSFARRDRSGSREGDRSGGVGSERRSSRNDRVGGGGGGSESMRRSNSRDSADRSGSNNRSTQSIHSNKSHGSGGSGGSGGSRETRQSSRSHRSHRSSGSRESHRSRESNRSGSSRRSSGTKGSSSRQSSNRHHGGGDRQPRSDGEYGRQSSGGGGVVLVMRMNMMIQMPTLIA
ncbi:hypothetical protein ACHAXR_007248 [Thalassiosira sp. AJA248-18]